MSKAERTPVTSAVVYALAAAALFGGSTPFAKLLKATKIKPAKIRHTKIRISPIR